MAEQLTRCNLSLKSEDWRIANTVLVVKGIWNDSENYRPVSLTSELGKLFDKISYNRDKASQLLLRKIVPLQSLRILSGSQQANG